MLANILIGTLLLVLTTFVHSAAMDVVLRMRRVTHTFQSNERRLRRPLIVAALVLIMFLASLVEATLWAATYLVTNAISDFDQALYFSLVTYSTLGYGDVTLEPRWQLLSAIQAANGVIMFGWTTAVIVAAVSRLYLAARPPADPSHP